MGDVHNLRLARKRAKRKKAEEAAAAQRLTHGTRKPERELARALTDKAARKIDQHRIE